jgi:hypothetical protein
MDLGVRQFDLNVEKVLEHWTMAHAVREVIANALDEQALTNTAEPEIFKDDSGAWHVRDFGRGLRYEHLTQNENKEKLSHPERIIGKFGVGLKDALATADRHAISVLIRSAHGDITIGKTGKHGFSDVVTLHALIHPPADPYLVGTDFVLSGLKNEDMAEARDFFLHYSGDEVLEQTRYGVVLRKKGERARIYVNGLCVAEEEKFLFSYNITSLTTTLRKALNRERTNVGRSAYTDRVKAILMECSGSSVADALASDLCNFETGKVHDELQWLDVALHACRILNANEKVLFVTSIQLLAGGSLITHARADGYRVIVVPQTIAAKLSMLIDINGAPVRDLQQYGTEWNDSFEFQFVAPEALSVKERAVFDLTPPILKLAGDKRTRAVKKVLISETMRLEAYGNHEALGLWDEQEGRIIVKRDQLNYIQSYVATLLHEIAHAATGGGDLTTEFEDGLTELLGVLGAQALTLGRKI